LESDNTDDAARAYAMGYSYFLADWHRQPRQALWAIADALRVQRGDARALRHGFGFD